MDSENRPPPQQRKRAARKHADEILGAVYEELRGLASSFLSRERRDHTLQPTALVHEAYLRLAGQTRVDWQGRSHFMAVSAQAMRRLLVNHAIQRRAEKRGGGEPVLSLDGLGIPDVREFASADILDLDAALETLSQLNARHAQVVELRFFAGMTVAEVAEQIGVPQRSVERDWTVARAWLRRELSALQEAAPGPEEGGS